MTRQSIAGLLVKVVCVVAFVACSDASPVAPGATSEHPQPEILLSQPELGQYDLEFLWNGTALTIVAHVRAAGGGAPDGGTAVLQYCSYNGFPTDDITQPDEAPSSACDDRSAHWNTLTRLTLNSSGDATLPFGPVSVVTVIGFRLRYIGEGSGVMNSTLVEDWFRPL